MLFRSHFKELSNEVEFKRLLKEIVDKYLGDRYVPKDLIHILIMEELESLIIKLISNYLPLVSEYYDLLSDRYETELNEIYQSYIYSLAKTANKRSHYKKVCNEIKRYKSLTGIDVDPIVEELKVLYKKRRAMIEELDKVSSKSKFVKRTLIDS